MEIPGWASQLMGNLNPTNQSGVMGRVVNGEMFKFFGQFAAMLCVPLIIWMLSTMVDYGKTMTKLDGQIAVLTVQIASLTSQLQAETLSRYTAVDAARDFNYRDNEIKGLTEHMINAEQSIDNLKDRVAKTEPRR